MKMQRTYIKDIDEKKDGKEVLLKGWVQDIRDLSSVKFLLLRDYSGVVQAVAKPKTKVFDIVPKISIESIVEIKGKVKKNKEARKGYEIIIDDLKVLNEAETLPITVLEKGINIGLSKRLDYRFLDMRKEKVRAVFRIQSEIINAFREFFTKNDFIEIQAPGIISTATEGGTDLFPVKYFEKNAYLAQSPQLYKQMAAISLERVFSTMPVWRAEKHNTVRHLNESRQMDIEVAFADEMEIMKWMEKVIQFIVKKVIENCKDELKALNINLKVPKALYITYEEAVKKLKGMKYGDDFENEHEKKLCEMYPDTIIFIHEWPRSLKPFYIMPKDDKVTRGFDALYEGMEISSGGQRVHIPKILEEQLKKQGLNPKDFEYYISAFKYGAPKHSGWGLGLERLTMCLCGLDNIREACMFPRDRDRLVP
jgi:aspartyl-tRNA synthetase